MWGTISLRALVRETGLWHRRSPKLRTNRRREKQERSGESGFHKCRDGRVSTNNRLSANDDRPFFSIAKECVGKEKDYERKKNDFKKKC